MIDLLKDECHTLKAAGRLCKWAGPKGVPYSTIHSWAYKGVKGIKLETLFTPQGRVTTMAAIMAFIAAINAKDLELHDAKQKAKEAQPQTNGATNGQDATPGGPGHGNRRQRMSAPVQP